MSREVVEEEEEEEGMSEEVTNSSEAAEGLVGVEVEMVEWRVAVAQETVEQESSHERIRMAETGKGGERK